MATGVIGKVTISRSGWTSTSYKMTSWSWSGYGGTEVDATNFDSVGWKEYISGTHTEPGEVTCELEFTGVLPTVNTEVSTTFTFATPAGVTLGSVSGTALLKSFEPDTPLDDKWTATATFKWMGALTIA